MCLEQCLAHGSAQLSLFVLNGSRVGLQRVLISAAQQGDSAIHTYMFSFFFIMIYHRILHIVQCAIQQDLVVINSNAQTQRPNILFCFIQSIMHLSCPSLF